MVNLKNARTLQSLARQQTVASVAWRIGRWALRLFALALVILVVASVTVAPNQDQSFLIGSAAWLLSLTLILLVVDYYLRDRWAGFPTLVLESSVLASTTANLADYLSPDAARWLIRAASSTESPNLALLQTISGEPVGSMIQRAGFAIDQWLPQIATPVDWQTVLAAAGQTALTEARSTIDDGDLLLTLFDQNQPFQAACFTQTVHRDDILAAVSWLRRIRILEENQRTTHHSPHGIARDWTMGYTPLLSRYGLDLVSQVGSQSGPIYGREHELENLIELTAEGRNQHVLLIGQPGTGRARLISGLAQHFANLATRSIRLIEVDVPQLLDGTDPEVIAQRMSVFFAEAARAGNVILFLPDIHLLTGRGSEIGSIDASEILLNTLQYPGLQILATTTLADYQARLVPHQSLVQLFERMDIHPLEPEATLLVLEDQALRLEGTHHTVATIPTLKKILEISNRYMHDQPLPSSAVMLLGDVMHRAGTAQMGMVTPQFVEQVASDKLQVPLEVAGSEEKDRLVHLEEALHETVVGQDEAIGAIAAALRRARTGLASGKRPIASFLFLGPTGVGKTEVAKALARVYFTAKPQTTDAMLRLDMSEYQQADGLVRLVGTPTVGGGGKAGGLLADSVHDHPFSLVLLDELEKAHPQILNLFLQVLDDGHLTDGIGRQIDFTNTIIIATSNAGAELIRQSVAAGEPQDVRQRKLLDQLQSQGVYRPEFLNRFDGIIAFHPLSQIQIEAVVRLMLAELAKRVLDQQEIDLQFSDDLITTLAARGFDPAFGARPIRRLIQDKVETYLAQALLQNQITRGGHLVLSAAHIQ